MPRSKKAKAKRAVGAQAPQQKTTRQARQQPKKTGRTRGAGAVRFGSSQATQPVGESGAPLAMGYQLPPRGMRMSDRAQKVCDAGTCNSVRIEGTDICAFTPGTSMPGNSGAASLNGLIDASGANQNRILFGPNAISSKLSGLAGNYGLYAFREIELTLIPACNPVSIANSTANGPYTLDAGSLYAFALLQDASAEAADGPLNFAQTMEVDPSTGGSFWRGARLRYRYTGTKCWSTSRGSGGSAPPYDNAFQMQVTGFFNSSAGLPVKTSVNAQSAQFGCFAIRYVLDLYRPQEPNAFPSLSRSAMLRAVGSASLPDLELLAATLRERLEDERKERPPPGSSNVSVVSTTDLGGPPSGRSAPGGGWFRG